jgi:hypothetical protein
LGNEAQSNMQWGVVLLILFAALLHAGWNVLIKSESNNSANTALIVAGSAAFDPDISCFPCCLLSWKAFV